MTAGEQSSLRSSLVGTGFGHTHCWLVSPPTEKWLKSEYYSCLNVGPADQVK